MYYESLSIQLHRFRIHIGVARRAVLVRVSTLITEAFLRTVMVSERARKNCGICEARLGASRKNDAQTRQIIYTGTRSQDIFQIIYSPYKLNETI